VGLTAAGDLGTALRDRVPRIDPDDVESMMDDLLPVGEARQAYVWRFGSLMVLAAAIAGFGMLADSSAVVIGAMLVAPLMSPILATAASICTADDRRLLSSILTLTGGVALAVIVGLVVSRISGNTVVSADDLPTEVLSRTSPQLIDLGIAVAAGAAGGYVAPRRDAVGALPGVGIAVALVPPLTAVGICLEVRAGSEAAGAMLLFLTNLAAIVFAGALMLLAAGVSPDDEQGGRLLRRGLFITVAAVAAVAVPLSLHTVEVLEDTRFSRDVNAAIRQWDDSVDVVELETDVDDGLGLVELRIATSRSTPPAWRLAEEIGRRHGGPVDLLLSVEDTTDVEVSLR
jgi:uncharacterized hydrophobic protein (TIGR00271 family)